MRNFRKNPTCLAVRSVCEAYGLDFEIRNPVGRGHPKAIITDGTHRLCRPIAKTPKSRICIREVESRLCRELRDAGFTLCTAGTVTK